MTPKQITPAANGGNSAAFATDGLYHRRHTSANVRRQGNIDPLAVGDRDAAKLIGVSARTLWSWRKLGTGPHHRKIGGRVLYPVAALHAFLNEKGAPDHHA